MMLAYLLHAANKTVRNRLGDEHIQAFYRVKDLLLKKYGKVLGYDVQKIDGKRCNSCGGRGQHPKYGHNGKIYDWADCWHCIGGWYKLPKWIALHRIKFGSYEFHRPLKRHECVQNPFTEEELGWKVSDRPVIKGYIDHESHWFGVYATMILFMLYDRPMFRNLWAHQVREYDMAIRYLIWRIRRWPLLISRPKISLRQYWDEDMRNEVDLPF